MSESLPCGEIKIDKNVYLEYILNTLDDSDVGYFVECDLKNPHKIKEETKNYHFSPENKTRPQDKLSDYMNEMTPKSYTQNKKLLCNCTDEKNYFVHYRTMEIYVRHEMIVDKVHEIILFMQSKWLVN